MLRACVGVTHLNLVVAKANTKAASKSAGLPLSPHQQPMTPAPDVLLSCHRRRRLWLCIFHVSLLLLLLLLRCPTSPLASSSAVFLFLTLDAARESDRWIVPTCSGKPSALCDHVPAQSASRRRAFLVPVGVELDCRVSMTYRVTEQRHQLSTLGLFT